jgi:ribosomal protein L22
MSPRNPQDPQKASAAAGGRGDERSGAGPQEDVQAAQDAAEAKQATEKPKRTRKPAAAKSEDAPKPRRTRKKVDEPSAPADEAVAAAETGVDKEGAAAAKASEGAPAEWPARRRRGPAAGDAPAAAPRRTRNRRREAEPAVLVSASAKYVRTSARKARLVCDHIRDKDVQQARAILAFTPRGVARDWSKLLESAVANAEHNHELVGEELRIHSVVADEGPTLKRFRPRAMGRATRIRKRTSHLTITLTPKES